MNHDSQCPLCQEISDTDKIRICMFHTRQMYEKITGESISNNIAEIVEMAENFEI